MNAVDCEEPTAASPSNRSVGVVFIGLAAISIMAGVSLVAWLSAIVSNRSSGLDVTDEAYYLLNARFPDRNIGANSDFGFYLRPLLDLGGSVAGLRLLGLVALLASSALMSRSVVAWVPAVTVARPMVLAAAWTTVASATTVYYGPWLPTPSYNLLTAAFAMVAAAGFIAAAQHGSSPADEDHELRWFKMEVGVLGGCLVLGVFIKPTAFVVIGIIAISALAVVIDRARIRPAFVALLGGAATAIPIHLLLVRSGPLADLRRLARGFEYFDLLESHDVAKVLETDFLASELPQWLMWLAAAAITSVALRRSLPAPHHGYALALIASASFVPLALQLPPGGWEMIGSGAGWWWLRLGSLALVWITASADVRSRELILGPAVFLIAPAAAFGSNNGFIHQTSLTPGLIPAAILIQAIIVASRQTSTRRSSPLMITLLPLGLAVVVTFGLRSDALQTPYRLGGSVAASTEPIELAQLGTVRVSAGTALYVEALQALADSVDPAARSCFVDLTGGTPVSALALDAIPAAFAWLAGGFPGSEVAADSLLQRAECLDGPVLLLESADGALAIPRPSALDGMTFEEIGRVHFSGITDENQTLSVSSGR